MLNTSMAGHRKNVFRSHDLQFVKLLLFVSSSLSGRLSCQM